MKNYFTKMMALACMFLVGATNVGADTHTITWNAKNSGTLFTSNRGTVTVDGDIIVSFAGGAYKTNREFEDRSKGHLLVTYGGDSFTLTPGWGVTITGFELNAEDNFPELKYIADGGSAVTIPQNNSSYQAVTGLSARSSLKIQNVASTTDLYLRAITITYTSESHTWANTTTSIDASGITNTDLFNSSSAGSLSATVTPGNGAVTWSGSNDAVATIDATGAVTLHHAGSVTFTATFEGVWGSYNPSSATYQMTVTNSQAEPNKWVKTELSQITSSDIFVIVGTSGSKTYALPNVKTSSASNPLEAIAVEIVTDGNNVKRINSLVEDNFKWNLESTSSGYIFHPNGKSGRWLFCNSTGNGTLSSDNNNIYIGAPTNTAYRKHFKLTNNKLYVDKSSNISARYLSVASSSDGNKHWYGKTTSNDGSVIEFYKLVLEPSVNVMISEIGYSTLYYGEVDLEVPAGVEAYTYTLNGINLEVSKTYKANTSDNVIPAGEAVVLKGAKNTSYSFNVSAPSNTLTPDPNNNVLKGTDVRAWTNDICPDKNVFYALSHKGGQNVGFYWAADKGGAFECPAHKAFLATDQQIGVKNFIFDDEDATGINAIDNTVEDGAIYNVAGQRLQKMQKGINIVNGKKILK